MKLSELNRGEKFTTQELNNGGIVYRKLHVHPDLKVVHEDTKYKFVYMDVETYGVFASNTDYEVTSHGY